MPTTQRSLPLELAQLTQPSSDHEAVGGHQLFFSAKTLPFFEEFNVPFPLPISPLYGCKKWLNLPITKVVTWPSSAYQNAPALCPPSPAPPPLPRV